MNCGTCRYWMADTAIDRDGFRQCRRIPEGDFRVDHEIAYTQDYDDRMSKLMTRAEFGCVLYEQGENNGIQS